mgnify:FL=1
MERGIKKSNWGADEKSVTQLVQELKTFDDQDLIVMVSADGGATFRPVKLLGKGFDGDKVYCTLFI